MAQKRKNKSKKWLFWALLVVLFVVVGVIAFVVGRVFFADKAGMLDQQLNGQKEEQTEVVEETEEETVEADETATEEKPDRAKQYEGEDPNTLPELTGVITFAGRGQDGKNLEIYTQIDQYLSGGVCELILMRGDAIVDGAGRSTRIIPDASTSTCEDGFEIPLAQLPAGNYRVIINLSSGGKTGVIEGEANI